MQRAKRYDLLDEHGTGTPRISWLNNPGARVLIRFAIYLGFFGIITAMIFYIIHSKNGQLVEDSDIVEWSQLIVLFLTTCFFYAALRLTQKYRLLYGILPLLCMMAGCRELDYFLSRTWIIPIIFLASLFLYRIFTHFRQFKVEAQEFLQTQQFSFLIIGFFIACIFAQISNREDVWRAILGLNYDRKARFFEEILEFLGYGFLLIGSIECYFSEMFRRRTL